MDADLVDDEEVADSWAEASQPDDTALACFILLLKCLRVPADPEQLRHERGRGTEPFSISDLLSAAQRLGVEAKHTRCSLDRLERLPLPAIATLKVEADGLVEAVILLRAETGDESRQLLIQRADANAPEFLSREQAKQVFTGDILLLTTRERLAGQVRQFDVSWFIPALVKYRKPLRDVLLASFFIQIIALVSPIFFQLVIDKVLVHHAMTTLHVLAIGLAVVSIWEVLLSGLRTWLFAHTTSRIDAELGAKLFRHLLNLPLSYFEARRVGDSVARVRELETIREFLTSNTLTLVIDLVFTVVFFAVMYAYSPLLTLVVVLSIPLYVLISVLITRPLRARLDEKFRRGAENQAFLVETVTAVGTLKAMAVEPMMRDKWERQLAGNTRTGFAVTRLSNWGSQLVQLISKFTTVGLLYFGASEVIDGALTVGALVAFNIFAGRVSAPILRLSQLWQDFQQVRISVERLGDVLNAPSRAGAQP